MGQIHVSSLKKKNHNYPLKDQSQTQLSDVQMSSGYKLADNRPYQPDVV